MDNFDIGIIGAGPGGYDTALYAARQGFRVLLIERDKIGGTCLNSGCIPTKNLLASAKRARLVKSAADFGIMINPGDVSIDFARILSRSRSIVEVQTKAISVLLHKAGVQVVSGTARIKDTHQLAVGAQVFNVKNIIIATGTRPADLAGIAIDHESILSSDDLLALTELPSSLVILGGGVMGCEFAFIMKYLGVEVTVVEQQPSLLPLEDDEVSSTLLREMKKAKIAVRVGAKLQALSLKGGHVEITLDGDEILSAAKMVVTVGRQKQTFDLGLETVSITPLADGSIPVNEYCQTQQPTIFAVGDCTGKKMLAHVATEQGRAVVDFLKGHPRALQYHAIPAAIFTVPEIASVGLTEKALSFQGVDFSVKKYLYRALGKAHAEDEIVGFFKVMVDNQTQQILGAHLMGEHASDIIMEAAVCMANHIDYKQLEQVVHAHPTFSEGLKFSLET